MEKELRFGLDLGRLAILKKKRFGPIVSNFLGQFFQVFMGKINEKMKSFVASAKVALKKSISFS